MQNTPPPCTRLVGAFPQHDKSSRHHMPVHIGIDAGAHMLGYEDRHVLGKWRGLACRTSKMHQEMQCRHFCMPRRRKRDKDEKSPHSEPRQVSNASIPVHSWPLYFRTRCGSNMIHGWTPLQLIRLCCVPDAKDSKFVPVCSWTGHKVLFHHCGKMQGVFVIARRESHVLCNDGVHGWYREAFDYSRVGCQLSARIEWIDYASSSMV